MAFHAVRGLGQLPGMTTIPLPDRVREQTMRMALDSYRSADRSMDDIDAGGGEGPPIDKQVPIYKEPLLWVAVAALGIGAIVLWKGKK